MKINTKILLAILTTSFFIFALTIGILTWRAKKKAYTDAIALADAYAERYANEISSQLNIDFGVSRALAKSFLSYHNFEPEVRQDMYNAILLSVAENSPEYLSVWASWELNTYKQGWYKPYGRLRATTYYDNGGLSLQLDTLNTEGDAINSVYFQLKLAKKESVIEPYFYTYNKVDTLLETSIAVPIVEAGKFIGLAGLDVPLNRYQKLIDKIKPLQGSSAFLLSNGGKFVAHANKHLLNRHIDSLTNGRTNFGAAIIKGEKISYSRPNYTGEGMLYVTYVPVKIAETNTPWSLGIVLPIDEITADADHSFHISIILGLVGLLILSVVVWYISSSITRPIVDITQIIKSLDEGEFTKVERLKVKTKDEVGIMAQSLNGLIGILQNTSQFALHIGEGKLDSPFTPSGKNDVLGNTLLEMRRNLIKTKEEQDSRRQEEEKLRWIQKGLSLIGDVLRQHHDDLQELAYNIIKTLVQYLQANQAGLFYLNEDNPDDKYIEFLASFAYDKRKLVHKRIEIGDSLVGRCIQENDTIYLRKLPENYLNITSGLGEHSPRFLLLEPLKTEDSTLGIIEIASFKDFLPHHREFIKQAVGRITLVIANAKKNEETKKLLQEAQIQSETRVRQEEIMQKHLKKLRLTQEESSKREFEMQSILNSITEVVSLVYFDLEGKILEINDKNLIDLGFTREQMLGRYHHEFAREARETPDEYKLFWHDLQNGLTRTRVLEINAANKKLKILETYSPVFNKNNRPYMVINVGINVSEN